MNTDLQNLVELYPAALDNPDLMRGWKRRLTLYLRKRLEETGSQGSRLLAAVKMSLSKKGYDTSPLDGYIVPDERLAAAW